MSESDKDIDLDPRIQIELEKLNITTDEINKLEIEYDVCNVHKFCSMNFIKFFSGGKYNISNTLK